ncbi:hypothetical protein GIB67_006899 [Kingdonia uniflora]|uniref:TFIIB-type domain-containing protein n=1 Tax=Kingdonia uniflora TaxID=39325 RepID=A0A7J7L084_9MAGN|nr:hypothetical protein GIB67_006899 [Kingdonia uniflora]
MGDAYCTECKRNTEVVFDHSAGDTVCYECGLVLESHSIDETFEWRTFGNEASDNDPNRVGGPSNPLLNYGSLTTVISKANGASGGDNFPRWQNRGSNPERTLVLPFKNIAVMCDRIVLTEASPDVDEKTISEDEIVYPKGREASNRQSVFAAEERRPQSPKISREYIEHPQLSPVREEDTCKIPEGISSQIFGGIIAFMEQESRLDLQNKLNECKVSHKIAISTLKEKEFIISNLLHSGAILEDISMFPDTSIVSTPASAASISCDGSDSSEMEKEVQVQLGELQKSPRKVYHGRVDWVLETGFVPGTDNVGGGSNGDGKFPSGGGGGRGEDDDDDDEENEFEPLLKFEEIVIDTCCATFAEVQKRGKKFWAEFELYVADMLVGVVVNVALVGLLAPYVRIGQPSLSKGLLGRMQHAYNALPSRLVLHLKDNFLIVLLTKV